MEPERLDVRVVAQDFIRRNAQVFADLAMYDRTGKLPEP